MNGNQIDKLWACLCNVMDPEVGINVVELGLIYKITVTNKDVHILMTMTSAACPMGDLLLGDVKQAICEVIPDGVKVNVELTFDPLWDPSMMSEIARKHFGW
jgi:metal-sulfur cluster biosynthetic enzyme